jgi:hypothetical protein
MEGAAKQEDPPMAAFSMPMESLEVKRPSSNDTIRQEAAGGSDDEHGSETSNYGDEDDLDCHLTAEDENRADTSLKYRVNLETAEASAKRELDLHMFGQQTTTSEALERDDRDDYELALSLQQEEYGVEGLATYSQKAAWELYGSLWWNARGRSQQQHPGTAWSSTAAATSDPSGFLQSQTTNPNAGNSTPSNTTPSQALSRSTTYLTGPMYSLRSREYVPDSTSNGRPGRSASLLRYRELATNVAHQPNLVSNSSGSTSGQGISPVHVDASTQTGASTDTVTSSHLGASANAAASIRTGASTDTEALAHTGPPTHNGPPNHTGSLTQTSLLPRANDAAQANTSHIRSNIKPLPKPSCDTDNEDDDDGNGPDRVILRMKKPSLRKW